MVLWKDMNRIENKKQNCKKSKACDFILKKNLNHNRKTYQHCSIKNDSKIADKKLSQINGPISVYKNHVNACEGNIHKKNDEKRQKFCQNLQKITQGKAIEKIVFFETIERKRWNKGYHQKRKRGKK